MSTRSIPAGTVNRTINLTEAEDQLWSRLAWEFDVSRGELIRRMLLQGVAQVRPAVAAQIKHIRENYKQVGAAAVCLLVVCLSLLQGADILRAGRAKRTRRDDAIEFQINEEEV